MFPRRLRGEIIILLCAKLVALTAIYFLLIAPAIRPEPDGAAMRAHLVDGHTP
ncbi:MAG TPA: hypothetical protein VMF67_06435 [Rhizomicrobium sp.]|nr:hypothetical protein [Rhizomicrobium sp.]